MSKNKYIFLGVFILVILFSVFIHFQFNVSPVITSEQAITISKQYVYKKYHIYFDEYTVNVTSDDNSWNVYYTRVDSNGYAYEGGGGPELHIKKSNGKVIRCLLQK